MKKGILLITALVSFTFSVSAQKYGHADAQAMLTELPEAMDTEEPEFIFNV